MSKGLRTVPGHHKCYLNGFGVVMITHQPPPYPKSGFCTRCCSRLFIFPIASLKIGFLFPLIHFPVNQPLYSIGFIFYLSACSGGRWQSLIVAVWEYRPRMQKSDFFKKPEDSYFYMREIFFF